MNEIWKDIKGQEGYYQISNYGRVKSLPFKYSPKENILKPNLMKIGYQEVRLRGIRYYVHRLVAENFILNQENKPEINHINGIKHDNHIDNLEWVTKSEQLLHSHRSLNRKCNPRKGIKSPNSKINELQLRIIRKLKGEMPLSRISKIFNMSMTTINRIHNNLTYKQ